MDVIVIPGIVMNCENLPKMEPLEDSFSNSSLMDIDVGVNYTRVPKEFYPECWTDDIRMGALFSPFRPIKQNPIYYVEKMKFWTNLITKYCVYKGSASVSLPELRLAFQRGNRRPYSLEAVLEEMLKDGKIQQEHTFMEPPQHTWSEWANRALAKTGSWAFKIVWDKIRHAKADHETYVVLDAVKKQANTLHAHSFTETVMSKEALMNSLSGSGLTDDGAELALHYLHCQKRAAIYKYVNNDIKITIIKIAAQNSTTNGIMDYERILYDLSQSIELQRGVVTNLEKLIKETDTQIRKYIREGNKNIAKTHLKKKHVLEAQLVQKSELLNNTEVMFNSLSESKSNTQVFNTLRDAAKTLKISQEESGITADTAEDQMADIRETLEDHNEIQAIITGPAFENVAADDAALEDELRHLIEEDEKKENERLDESIEHRLKELNITGFGDLTREEKNRILINAIPKAAAVESAN